MNIDEALRNNNESLLKTISDQILMLTSLVLRNNKEIDELKLLNEVKKTESFDPYEDYKEMVKLMERQSSFNVRLSNLEQLNESNKHTLPEGILAKCHTCGGMCKINS